VRGRLAPVGLVLCLLAGVVVVLIGTPDPSPRRAPGPPPKVFAFVSGLGGAELTRLVQVGARLDVVAPNWYELDADSGRLRAPSRPHGLLRAAAAQGVQVWPVVNARTGGGSGWEPAAARERIVGSLLAAARGTGALGVTLDMEELRPAQRDAFSALVRTAAQRLHAVDRKLAVYVPRSGPGEGAAYDWAALAGSADLLLASGYNEHWAGGPPGPTTTTDGFRAVVDRALDAAGPARAVPLLGAFGYRWRAGAEGELMSSTEAAALQRASGATVARADGSARFEVGADTVVYETAAGLRARVAAARGAGARWIGLFSLGREPSHFWRGIVTARSTSPGRVTGDLNSPPLAPRSRQ
jgi:spore germination protein